MRRFPRLLCVTCLVFLSRAALAAEPSIADLLKRPVISPNQVLEEVQKFTESRVPPMPEVKTVAEWEQHAERMRREVLENVVYRGEAAKWRDADCQVEWKETLDGGPGYRIRKLRYEALPGLWIPALLYEPLELKGKVPVVLNVNGHDAAGKAAPYKQIRCINQAKRGMLALNVEWLGMGQLRKDDYQHYRMNQLDLCGTSGLAPFYLSMKHGLDVLLSHEHADPQRVAVAGLSGGGWQTIFISAFDTRVTLCDPVAGYSSFRTRARFTSDLGDSEQTPCDLAKYTDYAQMTAMLAPRVALLTFNAYDNCCFAAPHALPPLLDAAGPIYELYNKPQNLHAHVNYVPGTHNFERDNREALYRVMRDHFSPHDSSVDATEISSDGEVKTREQLDVELPNDNATFHSLAVKLLPGGLHGFYENVPFSKGIKGEAGVASMRKELRGTINLPEYQITSAQDSALAADEGLKAASWALKVGETWTIPATELVRGEPKGTTLLIADNGRAAVAAQAEQLLKDSQRVLAVDPFYFGESKIPRRDFLYALLVSAVGQRPLAVQAAQIQAVAEWAGKQFNSGPVNIVAVGPRTSLIALTAAALAPHEIGGAQLHGSLGSLKELIEQNQPVTYAPEMFCFGLLGHTDLRGIAGLVAPRPVRFVEPSERVRKDMDRLSEFYRIRGKDFDPLK